MPFLSTHIVMPAAAFRDTKQVLYIALTVTGSLTTSASDGLILWLGDGGHILLTHNGSKNRQYKAFEYRNELGV